MQTRGEGGHWPAAMTALMTALEMAALPQMSTGSLLLKRKRVLPLSVLSIEGLQVLRTARPGHGL